MPNVPNDPRTSAGLITSDASPLRGFFTSIEANLAIAGANATSAQQQNAIAAQAAMNQGIITLFSVDTASVGLAAAGVLKKGSPKAPA
jgi:hypothetical protein